ncbi:MAG: amidohydrolase family protein [Acidimicrobiales bacterium]
MAVTEMSIPKIISVDDHVVEPPHLWQTWLPAKWRERGPKIELLPTGEVKMVDGRYIEHPGTSGKLVAWWNYDGSYFSLKRYIAAVGFPPEEVDMFPITYDEMRPGCWQPKERIKDMEMNGVEASLCFPNYPRFCGQIFSEAPDKELALACIKAYNDWMVEEWCGDSGGRLIPLIIVPLWDANLAADEIRRNAARGVRAVAFSELPPWLGLPSIHSGYWDPFFQACDETGTVISMHIGSGTKTLQTSADAPASIGATMIFTNSAASMLDYLMSDVLKTFPNLKLLYAECQIGWIPYVLERADDIWRTHLWSHKSAHPELPSTYYKDRIYSCFFKDEVGVLLLDRIGVDQVCFETDYPHQDGTWPKSKEVADHLFGHLDAETIHKLARGNAAKLLGVKD